MHQFRFKFNILNQFSEEYEIEINFIESINFLYIIRRLVHILSPRFKLSDLSFIDPRKEMLLPYELNESCEKIIKNHGLNWTVVERTSVHGFSLTYNLNWWKLSRLNYTEKQELVTIAKQRISDGHYATKSGDLSAALKHYIDAVNLYNKAEEYEKIDELIKIYFEISKLIPSNYHKRGKKSISGHIHTKSPISMPEREFHKHLSADYFDRMNPDKYYPLILDISDIAQLKKQSIENILTGERHIEKQDEMSIKTSDSTIIARPIFPGCDVTPPERIVDLRKENNLIKFFIVPRISGDIKSYVEFTDLSGFVLYNMDLPAAVDDPRYAKAVALYGMLSSAAPKFLGFFGLESLETLDMQQILPFLQGIWGEIAFTNFFALCGIIISTILSFWVYLSRKAKHQHLVFSFTDVRNDQLLVINTQKMNRTISSAEREREEFRLEEKRFLQQMNEYVQEAEKALDIRDFEAAGRAYGKAAEVAKILGDQDKVIQYSAQSEEILKIASDLKAKNVEKN